MKESLSVLLMALVFTTTIFASDQDFLGRAIDAFNSGEYKEAVRLFTAVIEDADAPQEDRVTAFQNRAATYIFLGENELAVEDFSAALRYGAGAGLFSGRGAAYSCKDET